MGKIVATRMVGDKEIQFPRFSIADLENLSNKVMEERTKMANEVSEQLQCSRTEKANILLQLKIAKITIDELYNNISVPSHCALILHESLIKSGIKDVKERNAIINDLPLSDTRKIAGNLIADDPEPVAPPLKTEEAPNAGA